MLRKIISSDAKELVRLRNQENTYKWFFSQQKFTEEKTKEWIENLHSEEVFVLEENNKLLGTVSIYNIENDGAEIGRIIIDEDFRGKGLGKKILVEAINNMRNFPGDIKTLYAYIMNDNIPSQRIFEGCGFILKKELEDRKYYELELE